MLDVGEPGTDAVLVPLERGQVDGIGEVRGEQLVALCFQARSVRGEVSELLIDAVDFGVIKMNIDTDTQYAFTRPVAGFMFQNYDGVLKIDGEVGNKKAYDPRAWGKVAEAGMAARVVEACQQLRSAGTSLGK